MMHFIDSVYKLGEAAISKPLSVVISGFSTVVFTAALGTTEFASQYPGIMITIISTIGAFCLVLVGVIYKQQMNVNTEVLAGLKELRAEIKADKEAAHIENEKLDTKIQILKEEVLKAEVIHEKSRNAEESSLRKDVLRLTEAISAVTALTEKLKDVKVVKIQKQ